MKIKIIAVLAILAFISAFVIAFSKDADKDYKLEQVIVISRHNVRAPLQKNVDKTKKNIGKPQMLAEFSAPGSNLTQKGCALETIMGAYLRSWLKGEGFLIDTDDKNNDVVPDISKYYFAASPRERTIASARAFAVGMIPSADVVVHHDRIGANDIDFLPYLVDHGVCVSRIDTVKFKEQAYKELEEIINNTKDSLEEAYKVIEKAVRYSESENGKGKKHLSISNLKNEVNFDFRKRDKDTDVIKEPVAIKGSSLLAANQISDALILQFYEHPDTTGTFLRINSYDEWRQIADIKDLYSKLLFTAPIVAVNTSHWLLCQVKMAIENYKFALLCTHDTSITALLTAIQADDYSLPKDKTLEGLTPNGCKLVIEKYSKGKKLYGRIRLLYQNNDQIHNMTVLEHKNIEPESENIKLKSIDYVDKDYYNWDDIITRIDNTLSAFGKEVE
ncbi:MAG: histidine-type phosphatase [Bacteroidales bacterium]|nr:histidine-type phosphatase [Bacteroidales bacterium]